MVRPCLPDISFGGFFFVDFFVHFFFLSPEVLFRQVSNKLATDATKGNRNETMLPNKPCT